jgi:uncharacterized protein
MGATGNESPAQARHGIATRCATRPRPAIHQDIVSLSSARCRLPSGGESSMRRVAKTLVWVGIGLAALTAAYLLAGGWWAAGILAHTLRVGAPTAQNAGWPTPTRPADIGYAGDPEQAYGYRFEDLAIAGDLSAWFVAGEGQDAHAPWAVFVHGIGGRRENGYRFLPVLRAAGLPTLLISYRNDPQAPTDPGGEYAFGLTEWNDLDAAIRYATDHGAPSVILVAESMGGGLVGQILRRSDHRDSISAIVLDSPALDFRAILSDQIRRQGAPLAPMVARSALFFEGWLGPNRLSEADVTPELAAFPGPIFLSHGFADTVVPVGNSDVLVSRRAAVTDYLRTDAGHIQSWQVDPSRYEASLKSFLATLAH